MATRSGTPRLTMFRTAVRRKSCLIILRRPVLGFARSSALRCVRFDVHYGLAGQRLAEREKVLRTAFEMTPERFVRGVPKPLALPQAVWINKPKDASRETFDTKVCPEVSHSC